jgi:hypothetical protein
MIIIIVSILYHLNLLCYVIKSGVSVTVMVLFTLTLTLHVFWFKNWVVKNGKKFLEKQRNKSKSV